MSAECREESPEPIQYSDCTAVILHPALSTQHFALLYLRIIFSEAVSASMNAGRLNRRSAYFMSGAHVLGSEMP